MASISQYALVTYEEAIDWLGDTTILTKTITPIINRASEIVERITSRHFVQRAKTVYYDGNGERDLNLFHYPIVVVYTVHVDNDREFGDDEQWAEGRDFIVYKQDGILAAVALNDPTHGLGYWPIGVQNVKISLTYGYSAVPEDIKQAVLEIIQDLYSRIGANRAITEEQVLNYRVKYAETAYGPIPRSAYDVLMSYADPLGYMPRFTEE